MKTLYLWEKTMLAIVAIASFSAGLSSGFFDAIMALVINTLIVFVLLTLGNKIFRKKNEIINTKDS